MRLNWGARPGLALLSIGVGLLGASSASAIPYEVFIDVTTEEGLYDLQVSGQISDASFDTLLLLFQTKVDINAAGRARLYTLPNLELHHVDAILAYRARVGRVDSIDTLVEATVLSPELADSVRAFVVCAPSTERGRESVRGWLRVESRWTGRYDRLPPATVAQTRISAPYGVDLGAVALVVRNQVGQVRWDPNRQALSARPEQVRFLVPKLYAQWTGTRFAMVAGTYRIGFGQRLTFDVTGQSTPDGFFGDQEFRRENELVRRCRLTLGERLVAPCGDRDTWRVTPDYGWTNRLTGVALRGRVELTDGALEAFVWGSYQPHRVPRLEIVRADRCADARFDDDPDCQAPAVYARETDLSRPAAAWTQVALPRMLSEAVVGAHLGYARND